MRAAHAVGAHIYCMEQGDLFIKDGISYAKTTEICVSDDDQNWYQIKECTTQPMSNLDVVFMRKDPPVDKRFIHTTYVLDQAQQEGVFVVNPPRSLREFNEKIFATAFPDVIPPYLIGTDQQAFEDFLNHHQKIIMKPLDGMGGQGVFLVDKADVNFGVIWEMLTEQGCYPIIAQTFIPNIVQGDKRILIIDGEPFAQMLVRLPKDGTIRGNLAVSGDFDVRPLGAKDLEIAQKVGEKLKQENILLAGIDIIGEYLTEVNITSPTGFCEIANVSGQNPASVLINKVLGYQTQMAENHKNLMNLSA